MSVNPSIIHSALPQGSWIENLYEASRGFGLGLRTFNSSILARILKKQSAKRPSLSEKYICDVICMVHVFTCKAHNIACGDQRRDIVLSSLMDDFIEKYQCALSMTDSLRRSEREGHPMTRNQYLNSNLQKWLV